MARDSDAEARRRRLRRRLLLLIGAPIKYVFDRGSPRDPFGDIDDEVLLGPVTQSPGARNLRVQILETGLERICELNPIGDQVCGPIAEDQFNPNAAAFSLSYRVVTSHEQGSRIEFRTDGEWFRARLRLNQAEKTSAQSPSGFFLVLQLSKRM